MTYDFDDILIEPAAQTFIESRYKDINPYYLNKLSAIDGNRLPLFTAPMDTVVNLSNMFTFQRHKINVVLPRTISTKHHAYQFNSYGLNDSIAIDQSPEYFQFALIDVANGHMKSVIQWAENLKKKFPDIKIMAGNIANPETYLKYCESGVIDFARIGIGNGNGCLTTQQTGVGYPMASLLAKCFEMKQLHNCTTKIIADGGMKKYSDIIKALAIGADYVMVGSIFNKALESAADNYWLGFKISRSFARFLYDHGYTIRKEFRGMSSKKSQKLLGNNTIRTSEGVVKHHIVEYTLQQWCENFEHYLRSAMSYTNCKTLADFIGKVNCNIITQNSYNRYNK